MTTNSRDLFIALLCVGAGLSPVAGSSVDAADTRKAVSQLVAALNDRDEQVRKDAAAALVNPELYAIEAIPALVRVLETDTSPSVRTVTADTIALIKPSPYDPYAGLLLAWKSGVVVPALLRATRDKDDDVRADAVFAFRVMHPKPTAAVPAIRIALRDRNVEVRVQAACALAEVADAHVAVPAMLDALRSTTEERPAYTGPPGMGNSGTEHEAISDALSGINSAGLPLLFKAATDKSRFVRAGVARSFAGRMRFYEADSERPMREQALRVVLNLLKDPDRFVRENAARAVWCLADKGEAAVIPHLKEALKDTDKSVRQYAADALKKVDPQAAAKAGIK